MPDSKDLLANLGINDSGVSATINKIISDVTRLGEAVPGLEGPLGKIEVLLEGIARGGKDAGNGVAAANKAAKEGSDAWSKYVKALEDANAAYQSFRRDQITGETSAGSKGGDIGSYSSDQLREYIAIDDARTANFISNARKRITAEEAAVAEQIRLDEEATTAVGRAAEAQIAANEKAAAASIAASDRQTAAIVANYTKQYEAAMKADADSAAAQQDKRYATLPNAARNVASVGGASAAQDEYSGQALAAMRSYYQEEEKASAVANTHNGNLITQRYALYDVATTYGIVGAAMLAADGQAVSTAASFESAFVNVSRTSDGNKKDVEALQKSLVDLSTQMPVTFEQLSQIAALGNQLGVKSQDIQGFTQTVSKFSMATGMTVDATSQAFGKLSNILGLSGADYERLGSSIALTGRTSAATESEIVSLAERLGSTARMAGFTADNVIGLSGAFGSLAIAPERGQGVMETYFNTLNKAVAEGGAGLDNFAKVTGLTTSQVSTLVQTGQGLTVFKDFLTGMSTGNTVEVTKALDDLGLTGLRTNDVVKRLAQNLPQLDSAMANAKQGYTQGTELNRQFAQVLDTVSAKWQIFLNSLSALGATIGTALLPSIKELLIRGTDLLNWLRDLVSNPAADWFLVAAGAVTFLVGTMFALRAMNALATASAFALATAQGKVAGGSIFSGIGMLIKALFGLSVAEDGAAVSARGLGLAIKDAVISTVIGGVLLALVELIMNFGESMRWLAGILGMVRDLTKQVEQAFFDFETRLVGMIPGLSGVAGWMQQLGGTIQKGTDAGIKGFQGWAKTLDQTKNPLQNLNTGLGGIGAQYTPVNNVGGALDTVSKAAKGAGASAATAAKQVHTLVDYGNDLQGVFSRAFDIRFGSDNAMDTISTSWNKISKSIADAQQKISEYQATMTGLTADRAVREYWLTVANTFGNTLRAGELRGQIADIDTKLAKTSGDLADAQDSVSGKLDGTSQAAIDNRATLTGLVKNYEDYITALASSGLNQDQLTQKVIEAKAQFISQATALGYPIDQVMKYAAAFDDVSIAVAKVPRNITVTANANPALQALNEFMAQAAAAASKGVSIPIGSSFDPAGPAKAARAAQYSAQLASWEQSYSNAVASGADNQAVRAMNEINRLSAILNSGNYAVGGWTGGGGIYEPAGIVHGQEFVLNHVGAQMFPREMLDAANKGQSPFYAGTGKSKDGGFGGMGVVELGPTSLAAVRAVARQEVALYVDATEIARAARTGNSELALRGEF